MHYYVYILRSIENPDISYVGYTLNVKNRLATHNAGKSIHTKRNMPWQLITCIAFQDKLKALDFEKYLKSHAGRVFCQKRFL